jgi:hypothetical protein
MSFATTPVPSTTAVPASIADVPKFFAPLATDVTTFAGALTIFLQMILNPFYLIHLVVYMVYQIIQTEF